jgi:hypothetical protein
MASRSSRAWSRAGSSVALVDEPVAASAALIVSLELSMKLTVAPFRVRRSSKASSIVRGSSLTASARHQKLVMP